VVSRERFERKDEKGKRKEKKGKEKENTTQIIYNINTRTSTCRVFIDVGRRCGTTRQDPKHKMHCTNTK
jgi:hypothetical protein